MMLLRALVIPAALWAFFAVSLMLWLSIQPPPINFNTHLRLLLAVAALAVWFSTE